MGNVKSAFEIAMEKADRIGTLSPEEKERMQAEEIVLSILRDYYRGKIDSNVLWQSFKDRKPSELKMAQLNLIDTLGLGSTEEELEIRKQGILALESLKKKQNTAVIEPALHAIHELQQELEEMRKQAVEDLKRQVEMQPQLRMRQVKTPDGRTVMMAVSPDEVVKAKLSEYLSEHEQQFNQEFLGIISTLKEQVK